MSRNSPVSPESYSVWRHIGMEPHMVACAHWAPWWVGLWCCVTGSLFFQSVCVSVHLSLTSPYSSIHINQLLWDAISLNADVLFYILIMEDTYHFYSLRRLFLMLFIFPLLQFHVHLAACCHKCGFIWKVVCGPLMWPALSACPSYFSLKSNKLALLIRECL